MQWRMIDGLGPFFNGCGGSRRNWSKAPFALLEENGIVPTRVRQRVTRDFRRFADRVAAQGFNAVTLDDLAHLTLDPEYAPDLTSKLEGYRAWYADLFACALSCGLTPFVTSDVMFYNATLRRRLGHSIPKVSAFFAEALASLFRDFPGVGGVITRIGEADAADVRGDFRSALVIRKPADARLFLRRVLPVCDRYQRALVFRTWSVGAYAIGDLMWNRTTCARAFAGLDHSSLVVSHKCGESDFFRYLPLNKQFFRGDYPKMIELQARREYEGCGEFPSFIGWDHEQYALALRDREDLVGFCVWCQTGGWTSFSRRAFLEAAGIWNELNTTVTLDVFYHHFTVEQSVTRFCRARLPAIPPEQLLTFLRLSDEVIKEVLYVDEFAQRKLFFRRLRVPPLLWVFWDHILINHSLRKLFRCFVGDGDAKVLQGRLGLMKIREMEAMAGTWDLRPADLTFMHDTFEILAAARAYFFQPFSDAQVARLKHLTRRYRKKHRVRYTILLNFTPVKTTRRAFKRMLAVLLRGERGYRFIDLVITIRLLSFAYPLIRRFSRNRLTDFADRQAMGLDTLFR